jgi:hypothetical protein
MGHSITYPTEITYWIVYDNIPDELVGYGELNTEQVLSTGRKYLWYTLDKIEFENKLLNDFGIVYVSPGEIIIELPNESDEIIIELPNESDEIIIELPNESDEIII